tara:strand:+ start:1205 stop:1447 length:243 start_codon:yes stop_codon:yes gene_type:complete
MPERTVSKNTATGNFYDSNHTFDCDFKMQVEDQEVSADGFKKSYTYDVARDDLPSHIRPITMMVKSPVGCGYIKEIKSTK